MTHPRHLRQRLRHAHRPGPPRVGKIPLMSIAALGAVTIATVPATQPLTATTGPDTRPTVAALTTTAHTPPTTTPAPTQPTAKAQPAKKAAKPAQAAEKAQPVKKAAPAKLELYYQYGVQTTGWYCGPAATRMALSARGLYPSQDDLAHRLGTTVNGTNSAADIARVLNDLTHTSTYQATDIPTKTVTTQQVDRLRTDIVEAISHGYPVVVNIAGTATDLTGTTRNFPGGHYITAVGYRDNGNQIKIGDSANPNTPSYWITTHNLATWAGTRGYAA